jgi:CO/xanthine dehydrogenase FAD-binding subunit
LRGQPLDDRRIADAAAASAEVETRGSWVASAEYRRHLAGVLVERCLLDVRDRL